MFLSMNTRCETVVNGVCQDSLLYVVEGGTGDYLLRGLITLGLLAFLMDLPKLFSDIFGLDLEQDAPCGQRQSRRRFESKFCCH